MTTTDLIPPDVAAAIAHLNAVHPRMDCGESISSEERARLRADVALLGRYVGNDPERAQQIAAAIV